MPASNSACRQNGLTSVTFFGDVAERLQYSRASWGSFNSRMWIRKESAVRHIFLALIMGVLSGQALAADLSVPPPPRAPVAFIPPAPVFTWSGIYIGGNSGYSFGTTSPSLGGLSGAGFSTNGIVAGGTIGGNYQAGAFVFGLEGDFDWDNINGKPSPCIGCQASSTWLATARGRAGVAWDRLLFYGTVGAAFQNVKFAVTAPPLTSPLATTVNAIGWVGGGGVEYGLSPNWSVKAEYLYVNFNNQTIGPGTFTLIENIVRGGVNYRF
jgi:outer membrane immunogenic protein